MDREEFLEGIKDLDELTVFEAQELERDLYEVVNSDGNIYTGFDVNGRQLVDIECVNGEFDILNTFIVEDEDPLNSIQRECLYPGDIEIGKRFYVINGDWEGVLNIVDDKKVITMYAGETIVSTSNVDEYPKDYLLVIQYID